MPPSRLPRLLIADDSRPTREHIVGVLQALGPAHVTQVQNGAELISALEPDLPDLILCDYTMPILDGLQALKILRRRWSAATLPVLMLTGSHSLEDKIAAFEFGANDYVTKPAQPGELLARVKAQLGLKLAVEENLRARDRLMQASKLATVGRLAAGMAHEMNTPAQYISDNLHFLTKAFSAVRELCAPISQWASGSAPSVAQLEEQLRAGWKKQRLPFILEQGPLAVAQSIEGIERIAQLITELKAFTSGSEGETSLVNLNDAIENAVSVARGSFKSAAEVALKLEPQLPFVPCRVAEIKQVLLELINNSVHAFQGDFAAGARGSRIEIATRAHDLGVELSVSDDGPGVPTALRQLVFDPSFTTKEVGGGTGQGLAVAHDVITHRHAGRVEVSESASGGACFTVWLPVGA